MKKQKNKFPVKAAVISAVAALLLFAAEGTFITYQDAIYSGSAKIAASLGAYDSAFSILSMIDINNNPAAYDDALYSIAEKMQARGDYDRAREVFSGLGEHPGAKERAELCVQQKAAELLEKGQCTEAAELLTQVMHLEGSRELYNECQYSYGVGLLETDDWITGASILWNIGAYKDSASLVRQAVLEKTGKTDVEAALRLDSPLAALSFEEIQEHNALLEKRRGLKDGCIAVGFRHTVGLRGDGTVVACGDNSLGQCGVSGWKDAVQIAAGAYHTAALLADGSVVACGDNSSGQCEVTGWKNVVGIAASDYNTFALLADGSVVYCGFEEFPQLASWSGIKKLCVGPYSISGINSNFELTSTFKSCLIDRRLEDASMSTAYAIGLTVTGEVVYTSDTPTGWERALSVYAYGEYVAIITEDYRPSVFDRRNGVFLDLPDAPALSVALGGSHIAVLYSDGTVYCVGENEDGRCDTGAWRLMDE